MYWIKNDNDKPCIRVAVQGSKVFECTPEWEVEDVYYNEISLDCLTVKFKKRGEKMGKKFVIELEDKVSENAKGEKLYFVKGFNNLSLDEGALKKLTEFKEAEEHKFEVGDVVEFKANSENKAKLGMITKTTPDNFHILLTDGSVRNPAWLYKDDTYTLKFIKDKPYSLRTFLSSIEW